MTIIEFQYSFLLMLIFGTLSVSGWFFSTRGYEQVMPDGSIFRYGKIFKGWYFFFMQKKFVKEKIWYQGKPFASLVIELYNNYPQLIRRIEGNSIIINSQARELLAEIAIKWEVGFLDKGDSQFSIYKEFDDYVFPDWIRDPLAKCATCFASLYGSIFYWGVVWIYEGKLFEWTDHYIVASIFFWVSFCFSLAVLNTALAKKFN